MNRIESLAGDRVVSHALNICGSTIRILFDAALWLPRFWIARSELGNLAAMTERDCRDIGLGGCEIEGYLTQRNRLRLTAPGLEDRRATSDLGPQR